MPAAVVICYYNDSNKLISRLYCQRRIVLELKTAVLKVYISRFVEDLFTVFDYKQVGLFGRNCIAVKVMPDVDGIDVKKITGASAVYIFGRHGPESCCVTDYVGS